LLKIVFNSQVIQAFQEKPRILLCLAYKKILRIGLVLDNLLIMIFLKSTLKKVLAKWPCEGEDNIKRILHKAKMIYFCPK